MIRSLPINNLRSAALIAVIAASFVAPGCGKKEPPAQPTPAKPAAASPAQQSKPVQRPMSSTLKPALPQTTQFDFSTKKDPFKPYVIVKPAPALGTAAANKAALPIHSFDVSQFKLIGIVTGGRANQAMVTDPNGKGYVLKSGMTIGKNDGRITAITNSGVEILEQFRDDNGRVHKEHIKITLPRKQ